MSLEVMVRRRGHRDALSSTAIIVRGANAASMRSSVPENPGTDSFVVHSNLHFAQRSTLLPRRQKLRSPMDRWADLVIAYLRLERSSD